MHLRFDSRSKAGVLHHVFGQVSIGDSIGNVKVILQKSLTIWERERSEREHIEKLLRLVCSVWSFAVTLIAICKDDISVVHLYRLTFVSCPITAT